MRHRELKCHECEGIRHIRPECPNLQKGREKLFLSFNDSDTLSEEEEEMLNFVAFHAKEDGSSSESESGSDEDDELDPKDDYRVLYDSWVLLSND